MRTLPALPNRRDTYLAGALLVLLLILTYWLYLPGLSGTFILDDYANLKTWESIGDINNAADVIRFSFSGISIPGRPLSLATFLIDDQSWPPDTYAIKHTSLMLHLLNATLCFWLLLRLCRHYMNERQALCTALFAAAVWTLHPIQVSNVSYIIQRMNLLSTTMTLAGLLLYEAGRRRLPAHPLLALAWCSCGIFFPVVLGVLCKENGLLLCAYALLLEYFFFSVNMVNPSTPRWWPLWKLVFLWAPLLLFVIYCLYTFKGFTTGFEIRKFNAWQRLLTQGPILLDYLHKIVLPHIGNSGLYNDNYPVSTSPWQPPLTALSWLVLIAGAGVAIRKRRSLPLVSFGILFYLVGHSMESTVLPLELYFEHRNYLPQLGIWMAVAALPAQSRLLTGSPFMRRPLAVAAILFLGFIAVMTRINADLWGNYPLQAATWYEQNPTSLRAALEYANVLIQIDPSSPAAGRVLEQAAKDHPNTLAPLVSERFRNCFARGIPPHFRDLVPRARQADYELSSVSSLYMMAQFVTGEKKNPCPGLPADELEALMEAFASNPAFMGPNKADVYMHLGDLAAARGDLSRTMYYYDAAFASSPNPVFAYRQANFLYSAGLYPDALHYLDIAQSQVNWHSRLNYPSLEGKIAELRKSIPK